MLRYVSHASRIVTVLVGLVGALSVAEAQERYPFEGTWSDLTNKCQEPVELQLRYLHDRSQSDSGSCTYRKVRQQGTAWVLDVDCDEASERFRATERITVDGGRMTRSRKVPWSQKPLSASFLRCDQP